MVFEYASIAPDFIVRSRGEEPYPKRQIEKDSSISNLCTTTNPEQENTTGMRKKKETRSPTRNLESESTYFKADGNAIISSQCNHPDHCKAQIR